MTLTGPQLTQSTLAISVALHAALFGLLMAGPMRWLSQGPIEVTFVARAANPQGAATATQTFNRPRQVVANDSAANMKPKSQRLETPPQDTLNAQDETSTASSLTGSGPQGGVVDSYAAEVTRQLNAQKTYPELARRMRQQGRVRVQFTLNRDGSVAAVDVLENSPHETLNEAARKLIERIRQFKPFPSDVKAARMVFTVPLEYTM